MKSKVAVRLSIIELDAVIEYNLKIANGIPEELYDTINKAGTTMREVVTKYRKRAHQLQMLKDDKWPK